LVKLYAVSVLLYLGLGEGFALAVIGSKKPPTPPALTGVVAGSIAAGFVAIAVVALARRPAPQ
jgi:hypothetical protein